MIIRRSLVAAVAVVALGTAPTIAQNRGAAMLERQQAFVDTIAVQLELPAEQEKAFRAIMAEQGKDLQAIFQEYEGQLDPQMRQDVTALREGTDAKLETVFSEEQMAEFIILRDEHRAQFRRGQQPQPGAQMPAEDTASAMIPPRLRVGPAGPG